MAPATKGKGEKNSVIIKRIKKIQAAHHGGAWKVAFADFTVSMMAFFMVMWLLASSSQSQLESISNAINGESVLSGTPNVNAGSASPNPNESKKGLESMGFIPQFSGDEPKEIDSENESESTSTASAVQYDSEDQLQELVEKINTVVKDAKAEKNVVVEIVPHGVRVRFQDDPAQPLFPSGSARLSPIFFDILKRMGNLLQEVNNGVILSGHTDSVPYSGKEYTNWELSAARAITARQVLTKAGMPAEHLMQLSAYAEQMPLYADRPEVAANRRIEMIVLTQKGEEALESLFGLKRKRPPVNPEINGNAAKVPAKSDQRVTPTLNGVKPQSVVAPSVAEVPKAGNP